MESLNEIMTDLSPIMDEFKEAEKSYFAYKRLNFIDKEIDQQVLGIALLDPVKANRRIKPLADEINALLLKSGSLNVDFRLNMMKDLSEQSGELSVDGSNAVAEMGEVGVNIMKVRLCFFLTMRANFFSLQYFNWNKNIVFMHIEYI